MHSPHQEPACRVGHRRPAIPLHHPKAVIRRPPSPMPGNRLEQTQGNRRDRCKTQDKKTKTAWTTCSCPLYYTILHTQSTAHNIWAHAYLSPGAKVPQAEVVTGSQVTQHGLMAMHELRPDLHILTLDKRGMLLHPSAPSAMPKTKCEAHPQGVSERKRPAHPPT